MCVCVKINNLNLTKLKVNFHSMEYRIELNGNEIIMHVTELIVIVVVVGCAGMLKS